MSCCCHERPTNDPRQQQRFSRRYMPTIRTVTVKSSGGDYSSLSSAEAGEQGDLASLDRQLDIECYAFSDTTAVTVVGWTTDATRYLRIFTPTAERHGGGGWSTSAYRLSVAGDALTISEEFVRLEGLQVECSSTTTGGRGVLFSTLAAGGDQRIDACILRGAGSGTINEYQVYLGDADANVTLRNSLIYGAGSVGSTTAAVVVQLGTLTIQNCTLIQSGGLKGINNLGGTVTATNIYVHAGNGSQYVGTVTRTTCAHSGAASFSGSTANVAHSTSTFANVTAGSEDYHLVSGSALIDAGTDLSGSFTTDIDGATRSGTWDIGADEFSGGGATAYPYYYYAMAG